MMMTTTELHRTARATRTSHATDARDGATPGSLDKQDQSKIHTQYPAAPQSFPHRILLAVTGLSPQIITETLYALAVRRDPPWVPREIHLLTTVEGAQRARLALLSEDPGWFRRLQLDYQLPEIRFDAAHIHILPDANGAPLNDIRTPKDNERAADFITERVRELTQGNTELHVSIAGGRKTMGYYLGYALSLFGRPGDRLSHVLVSEPFESSWDFFYPTPYSRVIATRDNKLIDTADATVTLAEIPFVRLRHGVADDLLSGQASFSETVATVQRNVGPRELIIDFDRRCIRAGGVNVRLPPSDLAFYAWFASLLIDGKPGPTCPSDGAPEPELAQAYLGMYQNIMRELDDSERTIKRLDKGMDKQFFLERKSTLHKKLRAALGREAAYYLIEGTGRPKRYALSLAPEAVRFGVASKE
ncbi:MAG TPA: CRISPR-associated ring nuclease Csm6 [Gammaproteobacteria bacterium]|nr:CRISPR-associated ring nuclease Csm6 [Gammaproteobacteria bacterium]